MAEKEKPLRFDPNKWKPLTKEQIEEIYGPLESYTWETREGKKLRAWFRKEIDKRGLGWMDFLYALLVEELTDEEDKKEETEL